MDGGYIRDGQTGQPVGGGTAGQPGRAGETAPAAGQADRQQAWLRFPVPDRVVARPVPPKGIPAPSGDGLATFVQPEERQAEERIEPDIRKIQAMGSRSLPDDGYQEQLTKLTRQLKIQQKEIQELIRSGHQMEDPRRQQRTIERMMERLRGQMRLERLQHGRDG